MAFSVSIIPSRSMQVIVCINISLFSTAENDGILWMGLSLFTCIHLMTLKLLSVGVIMNRADKTFV